MSIEKVEAFKVDGELREKPPVTEIVKVYKVDGKLYESRYEAAQVALFTMITVVLSGKGIDKYCVTEVSNQMFSMVESSDGREAIKALIEELEK